MRSFVSRAILDQLSTSTDDSSAAKSIQEGRALNMTAKAQEDETDAPLAFVGLDIDSSTRIIPAAPFQDLEDAASAFIAPDTNPANSIPPTAPFAELDADLHTMFTEESIPQQHAGQPDDFFARLDAANAAAASLVPPITDAVYPQGEYGVPNYPSLLSDGDGAEPFDFDQWADILSAGHVNFPGLPLPHCLPRDVSSHLPTLPPHNASPRHVSPRLSTPAEMLNDSLCRISPSLPPPRVLLGNGYDERPIALMDLLAAEDIPMAAMMTYAPLAQYTNSWGELWTSCFMALAAFERAQGSGCKPGQLPNSNKRPGLIKKWIALHRPMSGPEWDALGSGDGVAYGELWWTWWMQIQPPGRRVEADFVLARRDAGPITWTRLSKSGSNGMFIVLVSLAWWKMMIGDADDNWRKAITDVTWVLHEMKTIPSGPVTTKRKRLVYYIC